MQCVRKLIVMTVLFLQAHQLLSSVIICLDVNTSTYPYCEETLTQTYNTTTQDLLRTHAWRRQQGMGKGYVIAVCGKKGDIKTKAIGLNTIQAHVDCLECLQAPCKGDELYRHTFGVNEQSKCHCSSKEYSNVTQHFESDVWTTITEDERIEVGIGNMEVEIDFYDWPIIQTKVNFTFVKDEGHDSKKRSSSPTVVFSQPLVRIMGSLGETYFITINGPGSVSFQCNSSCYWSLPDAWISSGGDFIVQIYKGIVLLDTQTFSINQVVICSVASCFLCQENAEKFDCLPTSLKAFIIVGFIVFALFFIVLIILIYLSIKYICLRNKPTNLIMPSKIDVNTMCILCILLCAPNVECQCSQSLMVSSTNVQCVRSLNTETCQLNTQLLFSLNFPGQTICYDVINSEGSNLVGQINVTYLQSKVVAQLILDYWTSNWMVQSFSDRWCYGGPHCDSDSNCASDYTNDPVGMGGAITGLTTNLPGVSQCNDACGCAGCGCIICASSCVYSRWSIQPTPSQWMVWRPTTLKQYPEVQVCYTQFIDNTVICSQITLNDVSQTTINQNFSINLLGSLSSSNIVFNNQKLIVTTSSANAHFFVASEPNSPVAGTIGDIQSSTPASFSQLSTGAFFFDSNICTWSLQNQQASFQCTSAGVRIVESLPSLPTMLNNIIWSYSGDNTLNGVNPTPGPLLGYLSTNSPVTFTSKIDEVCPVLQFLNITGCYGCPNSAVLYINAKSECLPGPCVLNTKSIDYQVNLVALQLTSTFTIFQINFQSSSKSVDFKISCTSNLNSDSILISGTLDDPNPILVPNEHHQINGTQKGFNQWWGNASLGTKIGLSIGMSVGSLLVLGLIIFGIYMLVMYSIPGQYIRLSDITDDRFSDKTNELQNMDYN